MKGYVFQFILSFSELLKTKSEATLIYLSGERKLIKRLSDIEKAIKAYECEYENFSKNSLYKYHSLLQKTEHRQQSSSTNDWETFNLLLDSIREDIGDAVSILNNFRTRKN